MEQIGNKKIPPLTPAQRNAKRAMCANWEVELEELKIQVTNAEEALRLDLPTKKWKAQILSLKSQIETLDKNIEITKNQIKTRS